MSNQYPTKQDLLNAKLDLSTLDAVANSKDPVSGADILVYQPRRGGETETVTGVISKVNAQLANMGFTRIGTFAAGGTLTNPRQTLLWDIADGGDGQEYGWSGVFPPTGKAVPPNSTPGTTGGIDVGAWMSRFDPEFREDWNGFTANLLGEAGITDSGTNDTPSNSKRVDAMRKIFASSVADIPSMLALDKPSRFVSVSVNEYRGGTGLGGGVFKYSATTPKSEHNGGTVFSATVPWDGSVAGLANFVNGVGETDASGSGCYLRVCSDVKAEYFGCFKSLTENCAASWAAANLYAAKNHYELVMIDGPIFVDSTCVIDGVATNFRSVKLKGTFASTGVALNYTPDSCGSVVMTHGAPALRMKFNLFSNENYSIKGVGFIDSTYYPRGQPLRQYSPIELEKGNADGSSERYITGHILEDVVFSGYEAGVEALGKGPTVSSNFIGPTSCRRISTYNQGDLFRCIDSTMNHLWISDSNLFGLDGFGVNIVKTPGGPGGFADVTYSNIMIEGARGLLNTFGHGAGVRSRLVLNSVNRESCGVYGPNGAGLYTGNPLGRVVDTDIVISGVWAASVAFNEQSLPIAEAGATVSSSVPAEFLFLAGSKNLTPDSINSYEIGFDLGAGQTITKTIIGTGTDAIDATVRVVLNDGRRGVSYANIYGYTTGGKLFERLGAKDTLIDVVFSDGTPPCVCVVTLTNNSTFVTSVAVDVVNRSEMNIYSL